MPDGAGSGDATSDALRAEQIRELEDAVGGRRDPDAGAIDPDGGEAPGSAEGGHAPPGLTDPPDPEAGDGAGSGRPLPGPGAGRIDPSEEDDLVSGAGPLDDVPSESDLHDDPFVLDLVDDPEPGLAPEEAQSAAEDVIRQVRDRPDGGTGRERDTGEGPPSDTSVVPDTDSAVDTGDGDVVPDDPPAPDDSGSPDLEDRHASDDVAEPDAVDIDVDDEQPPPDADLDAMVDRAEHVAELFEVPELDPGAEPLFDPLE